MCSLLLFTVHYFIRHYSNCCSTASFYNTFERSLFFFSSPGLRFSKQKNIFSIIPSEFFVDTIRHLICFSNCSRYFTYFSLLSLSPTIYFISMVHVHLGTLSHEILDELGPLLVAFVHLFYRFMNVYLRQVHLFHVIFWDHILGHNNISTHDIS